MRLFEEGKLQFARLFGLSGEGPARNAARYETSPHDEPSEGDDIAVSDEQRTAERRGRIADARRAHDAEIRDAERRRREELPVLAAAVTKTEAEAARIRKALEVAEKRHLDARREHWTRGDALRGEIERARRELESTAWPWLFVTIEAAQERLSHFKSHERWQLQTWRTERISVPPHESDPKSRAMRAYGECYRMDRVATNDAALDAVAEEMETALKALRALPWRVEEPADEEVKSLLAVFEDAVWRKAAEKLVWKEPSPPKYDANGRRIAE